MCRQGKGFGSFTCLCGRGVSLWLMALSPINTPAIRSMPLAPWAFAYGAACLRQPLWLSPQQVPGQLCIQPCTKRDQSALLSSPMAAISSARTFSAYDERPPAVRVVSST